MIDRRMPGKKNARVKETSGDQPITATSAEEERSASAQGNKPTTSRKEAASIETERIELRMPEDLPTEKSRRQTRSNTERVLVSTEEDLTEEDEPRSRAKRAAVTMSVESDETRQTRLALQDQGQQLKGIHEAMKLLVDALREHRPNTTERAEIEDTPTARRRETERNGDVIDGEYVPRSDMSRAGRPTLAGASVTQNQQTQQDRRLLEMEKEAPGGYDRGRVQQNLTARQPSLTRQYPRLATPELSQCVSERTPTGPRYIPQNRRIREMIGQHMMTDEELMLLDGYRHEEETDPRK